MRILVTGGTGIVGWTIINKFETQTDLHYTYYKNKKIYNGAKALQLDLRDSEKLSKIVRDVSPDVIIHSAAMTDVDQCEENPDLARSVNIAGTKNIIEAATNVGSHLVFLSTSFVFDGSKSLHNKSGSRNPVNQYGKTKAEAEQLIERSSIESAIVRTDQPYGWTESWQTPTMVEWTLNQLSKNQTVEIFKDWYNVPIYLPDLAVCIQRIAKKKASGIFHAVGPDYINRYEWGCEIANVFGYDQSRIVATSSDDVDIPAKRPNVHLKNRSVTDCFKIKPCSILSGLEKMKQSD